MSNIIDIKYAISQLSSRVKSFKQKDNNQWNFRCPICGDSAKSKLKARGWIYQNQTGNFSYKCFNCGTACTVQKFLKQNFKDLYDEYRLSIFKNKKADAIIKKLYIPEKDIDMSRLLPLNDISKNFLEKRMIPENKWNIFYYCNELKDFINDNRQDGKYSNLSIKGRFLVTLIYNYISGTDKKVVQAVCARNIDTESKLRYIHAKFRDDCHKNEVFWGIDRISKDKPVIACEGIFDALFLDNSIALLTSTKHIRGLKDYNIIYFIDNEPRNKEISEYIKKHITAGRTIALLPDEYLAYGKDINEYILNGIPKEKIMSDILSHSYSGARALLEYSRWKKF